MLECHTVYFRYIRALHKVTCPLALSPFHIMYLYVPPSSTQLPRVRQVE